jgi:hypothetical protein
MCDPDVAHEVLDRMRLNGRMPGRGESYIVIKF